MHSQPTPLPRPELPTPGTNSTSEDDLILVQNILVASAKVVALSAIILLATSGNILVIVSVFRFERLRTVANWFVVSLGVADLLVAVLVMPFNAVQEVIGSWSFGPIACDVFNANDVLFSTASLLHLCCISLDRYVAITDPFGYASKMTKRRVAGLLVGLWTLSALLSHVPIHLGWYTTSERLESRQEDDCTFEVNKVYVVVSSTVSFWTPAAVMVFAYVKIFREARKQERHIRALRKVSMTTTSDVTVQNDDVTVDLILAKCGHERLQHHNQHQRQQHERLHCHQHHNHQQQLQLSEKQLHHHHNRSHDKRLKMSSHNRTRFQRDSKAAKTLGLIMGAFLCCWSPFFTWYVVSTLCEGVCGGFAAAATPQTVVSALFWVGYLNSVLNPFIYAFYNREFRRAFAVLLSCHRRPICPLRWPTPSSHSTPSACAGKGSSANTVTSSIVTSHPKRKRNYADAGAASGTGGRLESAVAFLCSGNNADCERL